MGNVLISDATNVTQISCEDRQSQLSEIHQDPCSQFIETVDSTVGLKLRKYAMWKYIKAIFATHAIVKSSLALPRCLSQQQLRHNTCRVLFLDLAHSSTKIKVEDQETPNHYLSDLRFFVGLQDRDELYGSQMS